MRWVGAKLSFVCAEGEPSAVPTALWLRQSDRSWDTRPHTLPEATPLPAEVPPEFLSREPSGSGD